MISSPVEIEPFVSLYGGFAGTETSLGQRDWQANPTVLNGGGITWPIVDAELGGNAALDGFVITSAGEDPSGNPGLFSYQAPASVNFSCVTATVANNTVSDNASTGIACSYCPSSVITGNTITGNTIPSYWDSGVGVYCGTGFFGVLSIVEGFGIGGMLGATADIAHNTISGNTGGFEGAGILCGGVTADVDANVIENDSYDSADVEMLGFALGGGLSMWNCVDSAVTNNIFACDMGYYPGGGAVYAGDDPNLAVVNNTFVSNACGWGSIGDLEPTGYGGAMLIDDVEELGGIWVTVANNIFYDDLGEDGYGDSVAFIDGATGTLCYCDAYNDNDSAGNEYYDAAGMVTPDSTCVSVDPQFSGPRYILPPGSSLHGAGSTDFFGIPWLLYQDIAGNPRPGPDGTTDMGAYESWADSAAVVEMIPEETLIPADGVSETIVYAFVLDSSGDPVPNATVTWTRTDGTINPAQCVTNSVGEATAMLTSSTTHIMATVSATSGGAVGNAYVRFGDPTDPTLMITSPSNGASVSGFVPLSISWQDVLPAGGGGTVQTELLVDDQFFCGFHSSDETGDTTINTNQLSNGQHEVTAVAIDPEGSETHSNGVWLNVYNDISEISVNETALFLDDSTSQPVTLSAQVNSSESWQITIYRCSDNSVVAQSSGTGPGTASITWSDSAAAAGIYDLSISPGVVSSGGAVSPTDTYIAVSYAIGSETLIMGTIASEDTADMIGDAIREMSDVAHACAQQYVKCTNYSRPLLGNIHRRQDGIQEGGYGLLAGPTPRCRMPRPIVRLPQLVLHYPWEMASLQRRSLPNQVPVRRQHLGALH